MDTTTPYSTRVAATVIAAMKVGEWSEKALAEATNIPRVTLRRRLAGVAPFNVAELHAIAATLGVSVSDLIAEAVA